MRTLVAALAALTALSAPAKADVVEEVLGCKGDPCVVTYNPGGFVSKFESAASAILGGARERVIIDGDCYSSCTLLADYAAENVCLTVWARLYFHRGTGLKLEPVRIPMGNTVVYAGVYTSVTHIDLDYRLPKVVGWINSIGGLPKDGKFVEMPAAIAHDTWPTCALPKPSPR